jgi:superfamily I DNA/RNA helicase
LNFQKKIKGREKKMSKRGLEVIEEDTIQLPKKYKGGDEGDGVEGDRDTAHEEVVEDKVVEDKVVEDKVVEDKVVEDQVVEDQVVEDQVVDDFDGADEYQRAAIVSKARFKLLLAGPGAGKTFTLILCIWEKAKQSPQGFENVLFTTFTTKAAKEMIDRLRQRAKNQSISVNDVNRCTYGTLHSICLRILKTCGFITEDYSILTPYNQKKMWKTIFSKNGGLVGKIDVSKLEIDDGDIEDDEVGVEENTNGSGSGSGVGGGVPDSKLVAIIQKLYDKWCTKVPRKKTNDENLLHLFGLYEKYKREENSIDFNDILVLFYKKLTTPESLTVMMEKSLKKIKHIFFDEYQDINQIQYEIMKIMVEATGSSFTAVGDEKQTIYTFRGSDNAIIHNFKNDFVNAYIKMGGDENQIEEQVRYYSLVNNYRSTPEIADMCFNWYKTESNKILSDKPMIGLHQCDESKKKNWIYMIDYRNPKFNTFYKYGQPTPENTQFRKILEILQDKEGKFGKYPLSQQVVMCRNRRPLKQLGYFLFKNNIPYEESGSSIMEKKEIGDLLAIWNFYLNPSSLTNLERIVCLFDGIGDKTAKKITEECFEIKKRCSHTTTEVIPKNSGGGGGILDNLMSDMMEAETIDFDESIQNTNEFKEGVIGILTRYIPKSKKECLSKLIDLLKMIWIENAPPLSFIYNFLINYESKIIEMFYPKKDSEEIRRLFYFFHYSKVLNKSDTKDEISRVQIKKMGEDLWSLENRQLLNIKQIVEDINIFKEAGKSYDDEGHLVVDKLLLSTIHAAKGCEFNRIFLLTDSIIDGRISESSLEEEKRISFVAVTRAKEQSFILNFNYNGPNGKEQYIKRHEKKCLNSEKHTSYFMKKTGRANYDTTPISFDFIGNCCPYLEDDELGEIVTLPIKCVICKKDAMFYRFSKLWCGKCVKNSENKKLFTIRNLNEVIGKEEGECETKKKDEKHECGEIKYRELVYYCENHPLEEDLKRLRIKIDCRCDEQTLSATFRKFMEKEVDYIDDKTIRINKK